MVIESFTGKYKFLSNMFIAPFIGADGKMYQSVEHYFQSHKSNDEYISQEIRSAKTPNEARRLGRRCFIRDDWEEVKDLIMIDAVKLKFNNGSLKKMLKKTTPHTLTEKNTWGDMYWGEVDGVGLNKLGKILMAVREVV